MKQEHVERLRRMLSFMRSRGPQRSAIASAEALEAALDEVARVEAALALHARVIARDGHVEALAPFCLCGAGWDEESDSCESPTVKALTGKQ